MIDRILRTSGRPKGCILCLPGRTGKGRDLAEVYRSACLDKTLIVGMTPKAEWFPPSHSPTNQREAVEGLGKAVEMIDAVLRRIRKGLGVRREGVALAGFSAGGVAALEAMAASKWPFAAVVCHSGCSLVPDRLRRHGHGTKVVLAHSKDDPLYKWDKRYLPTKEALESSGYDLTVIERDSGGHALFKDDLIRVANLIAPALGYPGDWRHPMTHLL